MNTSWYRTLAVVGTSVVSVLISVLVSLAVAERSAQRAIRAERVAEEKASAEAQKAREASRQLFCSAIIAQDDVYRETAPATKAGIQVAAAWRDLRAGECS